VQLRSVAAALALAAVTCGSSAGADRPRLVLLPPATSALTAAPPLLASVRLPEQRFPGRISSSLRVLVGVSPDGSPRTVHAVQRLVLDRRGDYIFAVGAPALDVRAGPGSASEPGLRTNAIVWQGFSPGRRVLSADATLGRAASAPALPVRLRLDRGTLVVQNATAVQVTGFTGLAASRRELDEVLAELRSAAAAHRAPGDLLVHAAGVRPRPMRVDVRLLVDGDLDGRRFSAVLGAGRPDRLVLHARPGAQPRLRLRVRPVYAPPAVSGAPTLADAVLAALRLARVRQFDAFLSSPDALGSSTTVYEYRIVRVAAAPVRAPHGGGWGPLAIAAASVGALLAAAGLVGLWARS